MAPAQEAVSFDQIIQAGRQKKKNEELANSILGKSRRSSAPGSGPGRKAQNAQPGSLASRIGVTKRSASASFRPQKNPPAPSASIPTGPANRRNKNRRPDASRLLSALNPESGQANVRNGSGGLSIKGASTGPFVVVGSNFAPGTTAADIQSAIEPASGQILNCWVTSQRPSVTAEIAFAEKAAAEEAIAKFHNQRADGRVLQLQLRSTAPGDLFDRNTGAQTSFNDLREQADRERRLHRAANPAVQDGSYGFNDQSNANRGRRNYRGNRNAWRGNQNVNQSHSENGLYSDEMMVDAPTQPRGRGRFSR